MGPDLMDIAVLQYALMRRKERKYEKHTKNQHGKFEQLNFDLKFWSFPYTNPTRYRQVLHSPGKARIYILSARPTDYVVSL